MYGNNEYTLQFLVAEASAAIDADPVLIKRGFVLPRLLPYHPPCLFLSSTAPLLVHPVLDQLLELREEAHTKE